MGTTVLLNLAGGIALLLSGLHMVQSGILRAFSGPISIACSRLHCATGLPHCVPVSEP
jgi:phosphate:Na+ symporter